MRGLRALGLTLAVAASGLPARAQTAQADEAAQAGVAAPAAGGVRMLPALERAPLAVVGSFAAVEPLDAQSWRGVVVVEVGLVGGATRGDRVAIAWEELSSVRPVRFEPGAVVLLALEPLPRVSLWSQRIPDPAERSRTFGVAERGDAFLRTPRAGSVGLLEHYLALPPALREANPGVAHLCLLAAGAGEVLARDALRRLAQVPALDAALDPASAGRLVAALGREEPEVAMAGVALVATQQPAALREPLREVTPDDASGPAPAYAARAALEALPVESLRALLARDDSPAHRAVGVRHALPPLTAALPKLLRTDAAPGVRIAALERLVGLDGAAAIDRVLFALGDPDPAVRGAAMEQIGGLGAEAVPALRGVAMSGSRQAATTAVGALRGAGPEGMRAIAEIAETHPDEAVRLTADVALGRAIGHRD